MTTFKYPIESLGGGLVLVDDLEQLIPQVIKHTLLTCLEERVMRPEFGIQEVEFNLMPNLPAVLRELERALALTLKEYPGTSVRLVGYADDSGEIPVICYWSLDSFEGSVEVTL